MIQLDFDAATPARRSDARRSPVGYSQHEGAERAAWGDDKLELVDGTHPVVYPAAGSHANFYGEALYLGPSASGASAATTRADRRSTSARWSTTIPGDPALPGPHPGSASTAAGASCGQPSSTARPDPI